MAGNTYASVGQRTSAVAAPAHPMPRAQLMAAKRLLIPKEHHTNNAGQKGPVGVKSGIVNSGLK